MKKIRLLKVLPLTAALALMQVLVFAADVSEKKSFDLLSKMYIQIGPSKACIDQAKAFIKSYPKSSYVPRAEYIIAASYGENNQVLDAYKAVSDRYSSSQLGASALFMAGAASYNMKNFLDAEKCFKKLSSAYPRNFLERESLYGLSQAQLALNRWNDAQATLNKLLKLDPHYEKDDRVRYLSALLKFNSKRYGEAYEEFSVLNTTASIYYQGRCLEQMKQYIQAVAKFRELLTKYPKMELAEEVSFLVSECFYRSEDYISADEDYRKFTSSFPDSSLTQNAYYKIGCCNYLKKEYADAILTFGTLVDEYPESEFAPYAKYMMAESFLGQNNVGDALAVFGKIITAYPKSEILPMVYYKIGWCYGLQDAYEPAIGIFKQLIEKYPNHDVVPYALFLAAENYRKIPDIDEAINYYKQVLNKSSKSHELTEVTLYMISKLFYENQRYSDIVSNYHYILNELPPSNSLWRAHTYLIVADAYYYMGQYNESQRVLDLVIKNFPFGEPALMAQDARAWVYFQLKEYDLAEKQRLSFTADAAVVQSTVAKVSSEFEMGNINYNQKKYVEALDIFEKFAAEHPESPLVPDALYNSARCYYKLEYYSKAVANWEKLANEYKDHSKAKESLELAADTYFRAQKYQLAVQTFNRIISEYPDTEQAKQAYLRIGQCYYNAGDDAAAISQYENIMIKYPEDPIAEAAMEGIVMASYRASQNKIDSGKDIEILTGFLEKYPNSKLREKIQFRLAERYYEKNDYAKSAEEFRKVLSIYSDGENIADAQFYMAESFYQSQNYDEAIPAFKRFIANFPKHESIRPGYLHLANALFYQNKFLDAAQVYSDLNNISKDEDEVSTTAMLNTALCYKKAEKWNEAALVYERFIKKYPKHAMVKNTIIELAEIYESIKQFEKAIDTYRTLIKHLPENDAAIPEIRYKIIDNYIKRGNLGASRKELDDMLTSIPGDNAWKLTSIALMAQEYESQKNWVEAIALYNEILKTTRDPKWVAAADERIKSIQGNR